MTPDLVFANITYLSKYRISSYLVSHHNSYYTTISYLHISYDTIFRIFPYQVSPKISYLIIPRIVLHSHFYAHVVFHHILYITTFCISPHTYVPTSRISPHIEPPQISYLIIPHISPYILLQYNIMYKHFSYHTTSRILPYLLFTRYRNAILCHLQALLVLDHISYLPLSIIT